MPDDKRAKMEPTEVANDDLPVGLRAYLLAREFHAIYERLAPSFGYETRPETRSFDPTSANGQLMLAVCMEILDGPAVSIPTPLLGLREIRIALGGALGVHVSDEAASEEDVAALLRHLVNVLPGVPVVVLWGGIDLVAISPEDPRIAPDPNA